MKLFVIQDLPVITRIILIRIEDPGSFWERTGRQNKRGPSLLLIRREYQSGYRGYSHVEVPATPDCHITHKQEVPSLF